MPTGFPDYGVPAATIYAVRDLGELAARLGSIVTFDRRGDVVWLEDFEDNSLNKWLTTTAGAGASVAISSVRARNGLYSCLLTAGSDAGRSANILHHAPFVRAGKVGQEWSFNLPGTVETLSLLFEVYDGTNLLRGTIRYTDTGNVLAYENSAGTYTTLATPALSNTTTVFHTWKLVMDTSTGQYVRLILNDIEYSMAGISGYTISNTGPPRVHLSARLVSESGSNQTVYVDDVIHTINEP